jgi:hypothetical protein
MAYHRAKRPAIGTKASYPGFIEPALASAIERVPNGERWVHEIKFDGYRVQVHIKDAAVKVFTRRGNDWTNRFRKIAADAWHISAGSAILDGEVVVPAVWTARPTFRCCRTNSRGGLPRSSWSRSICCTSMGTISGSCGYSSVTVATGAGQVPRLAPRVFYCELRLWRGGFTFSPC